jgi:hypothetical protein
LAQAVKRKQKRKQKRAKMKKFKNIINLVENEYADVGSVFNGFSSGFPRSAHSDVGVHRDDSSQINRIHAFANAHLSGDYLDPIQALRTLRAKINHAGLDFDFNNQTKLNVGRNSFQLNRYGEIFGTTPTHNLMDGFDRGKDYVPLSLSFDVAKSSSGKYYFSDISITRSGLVDKIDMETPSVSVREHFDESGKVLLESSDMAVSLLRRANRHPDLKTNIIAPLMNNIAKKGRTAEEVKTRVSFAAQKIINALHKAGKIDKGSLPASTLSSLSKLLHKKVKSIKVIKD